MRIGLDFDGVIVDTIPAMIRYAREWLDLALEPRDCVVPGGPARLGLQAYRDLVEVTHATPYALSFAATPGTIEAIPELSRRHDLFIVTARETEALTHAELWLEANKLTACFVQIHSSLGPAKAETVEAWELDYLVDDVPHTFRDWSASAAPLLWHAAYNEAVPLPPRVRRVRGWLELSKAIT